MHQIGLDEVARIHDGMREVAAHLGYTRPVKSLAELKQFFNWMKDRDDLYFKSREELLKAYQDFDVNVAPILPNYFNLRPKRRTKCGWSRRSAKRRRPSALTRAAARRQPSGHFLWECL